MSVNYENRNVFTLFLSLRCTHSCEHCLYGCSPDKGTDMSWRVFRRALEEVSANNISRLIFFGGEPLVNPEAFRMIDAALSEGYEISLATNCKVISASDMFDRFIESVGERKDSIRIITTRDKYHLKTFDPEEVIERLRECGLEVSVNYYANNSLIITEHNRENKKLLESDTTLNVCGQFTEVYPGVLPNGCWTICPPSLIEFSDIFTISLKELYAFKNTLPIKHSQHCTVCLKDFPGFREIFNQWMAGDRAGSDARFLAAATTRAQL